jgi:crotonobetainyl-CoA:carnitine CoA-transferase CaiB-like acyl-CoA transferase
VDVEGETMQQGLAGIRVLDFSTQIAGPYCSKLLRDAGASVIKVESAQGDSLRRWSATNADLGDQDAALFQFLNAGKESVVGRADDAHVAALIADADLVIEAHGLESDTGERLDIAALRAAHPRLVVLSITPYGCEGPWSNRQATEFTLQAEGGSISMRGLLGKEPFQAGGRIGEWTAGTFAAVASLPAIFQARSTGRGEHVDLSILETVNLTSTNYGDTMYRLMQGGPDEPAEPPFPGQTVETPSIEPTQDGYVGFCTNTRQQFSDFLLMIERPDLREDENLAQFAGRLMRFDEWNEIMHAWLKTKTTEEVIELASLLRIPVAPVCNGQTVQEHVQLKERGVFADDATGRFKQPRRPYRIDDEKLPPAQPAPDLGAHTLTAGFPSVATLPPPAATGASPEVPAKASESDRLPLAGLRVLDLTAWWAGPSAAHMLAVFGAEVVHVESTTRPDGMRMVGGMLSNFFPDWWEASAFFLHANTNKLGLTVDLSKPRGRELIERLVTECDAVVENFTPRVLENFGLSWERVHELNPKALMVRMPAFGLSGPWRDNTGFAQTMEQLSGLAWLTGHRDDQPRIQRGPCDPLAGMHATFAFLVATAEREASGHGHHVESTMVESALNVASEQLVEWTAYGNLMVREGNRSPLSAPQGLYPCADGQPGNEKWLALSIASDAQWKSLCVAMDDPDWTRDPTLATRVGRRAAHDRIDEHLIEWTRGHKRSELVAQLRELGIPASEVADHRTLSTTNPQLRARRYFEAPEHPVVGAVPLPSLPFRYERIDHWLRTPAPTLGQHNEQVLSGWLGLSATDLSALEIEGIIGKKPVGL